MSIVRDISTFAKKIADLKKEEEYFRERMIEYDSKQMVSNYLKKILK